MKKIFFSAIFLLSLSCFSQVKIHVHLDSTVRHTITGRLYVYTSDDTIKGVPNSPDLSNPQPMFAMNVSDWNFSKVITLNDAADAFSIPLSKLKPGVYKVAGVVDGNPEERGSFNPGNRYSAKEARLEISAGGKGETHLYLNREPKRTFKESDSLKLVELKSGLLSAFRKKDIFIKAGVVLPVNYQKDSTKIYPVVYIIPGWGGTHFDAQNAGSRKRYGMREGLDKIYVYLNPETQTPFGLHCFVDSRVNGPWGRALVEELLPYIRNTFRASMAPQQTFIVGQSSGGYAALWLPLHYPKAFGGGWAVSPDPVDFSNFCGLDLYAKNVNIYKAADGSDRPFFIMDGKPLTTLQKAIDIESFEGDGGQFQSFEAEFGKPDPYGRPKPIFNRRTGVIDKNIRKDWEPYDLGKFLQAEWPKLRDGLSGKKLHVYVGANDNFLLHKSAEAFKGKVQKAGADVVVDFFAGADHFSVWTPAFTSRVQKEIDELITGQQLQR